MPSSETVLSPMMLFGLSRAGKSSSGRILAERFNCLFYDTDEVIRVRTGLTPRQLYRQGGRTALHVAEASALRECCGLQHPQFSADSIGISQTIGYFEIGECPGHTGFGGTADENRSVFSCSVGIRTVITTGGGICENAAAAPIIAAIPQRVFLYADEAVLFERLTCEALHTGYYPAFLRFLPVRQKEAAHRLFAELYALRTEWYRRCCNLTVDTSGLDCSAVADKIAEQSDYFPRI